MDSPRIFPPLASPDLGDLPSTSSAPTNNLQQEVHSSSPECSGSFNGSGDRTQLLHDSSRRSSQHSLLMQYEHKDETTLI